MEKDKTLKLKNENFVTCYMQMLQSNIARMSNYSGIIKASMCVVYTILTSFIIASNDLSKYWWLIIVLICIVAFIDAYYLTLEKIYREKYNNFLNQINNLKVNPKEVYDMTPKNSNFKYEKLAIMISSCCSMSIIGFYGVFIIIEIAITILGV